MFPWVFGDFVPVFQRRFHHLHRTSHANSSARFLYMPWRLAGFSGAGRGGGAWELPPNISPSVILIRNKTRRRWNVQEIREVELSSILAHNLSLSVCGKISADLIGMVRLLICPTSEIKPWRPHCPTLTLRTPQVTTPSLSLLNLSHLIKCDYNEIWIGPLENVLQSKQMKIQLRPVTS